jgi:tRNA (guanosine-2'-O-)-methyltransferase
LNLAEDNDRMTDMTQEYLDANIEELADRFLTEDRIKRFDEVLNNRLGCITTVFEDFYDPHNANACIRTCEVFGCGTIHVVSVNNTFRANHGTSKSATRWVDVRRHPSTAQCFAHLKENGYTIIGTFPPGEGVVPFTDIELPDKLCIAMGCEATGLTEEAKDLCDIKVTIPQYGFTQSLNVSVSMAIVMEHYSRRYRESGREIGLPKEERERIAYNWRRRDLYRKFDWDPPQIS